MSAKLMVFNNVSLDGYFVDASGDMSWAHNRDPEWVEFTVENAQGDAAFLFGRVTYDMMRSFWPTPAALQSMPDVARAMNEAPKTVFSRTVETPEWQNTRIVKSDPAAEVRRLKESSDRDMLIMGSGAIIAQLAAEDLIDEYQIVVHPIVLGAGRTMFEGVPDRKSLTLKKTRSFGNGNVVMWMERQ